MRGQKHLIKCRCVLPQFKSMATPPSHQFMVFSIIDDEDNVITKYAQCNTCGIIHKVTDIADIKSSLPSNLSDILERHNVDLTAWEQAQFILENKRWGEFVILAQEEDSGTKQGKYVRLMSETFFKIETFTRHDFVVPSEN